jgi:hypothetical protein
MRGLGRQFKRIALRLRKQNVGTPECVNDLRQLV